MPVSQNSKHNGVCQCNLRTMEYVSATYPGEAAKRLWTLTEEDADLQITTEMMRARPRAQRWKVVANMKNQMLLAHSKKVEKTLDAAGQIHPAVTPVARSGHGLTTPSPASCFTTYQSKVRFSSS